MTTTTITSIATLDTELDRHGLTATLTPTGNIHLNTPTPPAHIATWIITNRHLVLDWLHFTCHTCHTPAPAAAFDTTGTPHCTTHMPKQDPAIAAAIHTLAALGQLTIETT